MSGSENPRSSKRPHFSHPDGFNTDKSKRARPNPVQTNINFSSEFSSDVKLGDSSSSGTTQMAITRARPQRKPPNKSHVHTKTTPLIHAARAPHTPRRLDLQSLPRSNAGASSDRKLSILEFTKKITIPVPVAEEPHTPAKSIREIPKYLEMETPDVDLTTPKEQKPLSARAPAFQLTPSASASAPSSRPLTTISSTRIARASNPNSEDGAAEILGWSLQQGGLISSYSTDSERDLMRGLEISPQKPGGRIGRAAGGLAGRAQRALERKQTSLILWYKDQEKGQGVPNLTMHISQLLQSISNKDSAKDEERIVLFSPQAGSDSNNLEEGQKIVVWSPYHAVQVAAWTGSTANDMNAKWNFTIDDTSPLFNYTPYSDAFGNGLANGWQTWYTGSGFIKNGGEASSGESFHLTNLTNASVTLQFYGSGIYLYGKAGCPYSVLLDSQQIQAGAQDGDLLFSKTDLQADTHYITLQSQITDPSSQSLGFDRAVIESTLQSHAAVPDQQVFDNQNTAFFQYSSGWTTTLDPQIPTRSDPRAYHQTSHDTGEVSFSFTNTTTLAINGSITWGHGLYQVLLDGEGTTLNGSSTWLVPDSLIFYRDNLDPGKTHTVNLTNLSSEKMTLNYVTLYNTQADVAAISRSSMPENRPHLSAGLIAACIISAVAVLALVAGLFWYLRRRPQRVKHTKSISSRDILGGTGLAGGPDTTAHPYSTRAVEAALWDVEVGRPAPAQPPPLPPAAGAPEAGRIVDLLAQRIDRPARDPRSPPPGYR